MHTAMRRERQHRSHHSAHQLTVSALCQEYGIGHAHLLGLYSKNGEIAPHDGVHIIVFRQERDIERAALKMLGAVARRSKYSTLVFQASRLFTSSAPLHSDELKEAFAASLPKEQTRVKALKQEHGSKEIHSVNVNMVIGGMRGITGLLYETSLLDPEEGIRFRGHTIPQLQVQMLPT
jgi:AraC-like DNA-binding protein